ncbi:tetratricopeptide repeat protein [Deferrisoma sp.]
MRFATLPTAAVCLLACVLLVPACSGGGGGGNTPTSENGSGTPGGSSGGGGPAGESGGLIEAAPSADALDTQAAELLALAESAIDETTRTEIEAVVTGRVPAGRRAADYPTDTLAESWIAAAVDAFLSGDQDVALWAALRAYEADPDDPFVLSQLGFVLLYRGEREAAKGFLLRAYELDPEFAPTLFCLGYYYEGEGDVGRAVFFYTELVALHPDTPYFSFPLARALAAAGQGEAARAVLEPAAPALTGVPEAQQLLESLPAAPEGSTDPTSPPALPTGLGSQLAVAEIAAEFAACSASYLTSPEFQNAAQAAADMLEADQNTQAEFDDSAAAERECEMGCALRYGEGPEGDLCVADCRMAKCDRDQTIAKRGILWYLQYAYRWKAGYTGGVSNGGACLTDSYYRHEPQLTETQRAEIMSEIWNVQTEAFLGLRNVWENDVLATLDMYRTDAATACEYAEQAIEDFDPFALSGDYGEMCGIGACVKWNGTHMEISAGAGPYSFTLSGSYFEGFTGSFGRTVWSKGPADVGLFIRFDSRTHTSGFELQGSVTGPITGAKLEKKVALMPR